MAYSAFFGINYVFIINIQADGGLGIAEIENISLQNQIRILLNWSYYMTRFSNKPNKHSTNEINRQ